MRYWRANAVFMAVLLTVWAVVGLGCGVLFVDSLNGMTVGGFPLGFWFAQQGSIISFVLLIPVIPFLLFGDFLQKWVEVQLSSRDSSLLIIALLCSDIFLPIPASVVCTFGGAKLR